MNINKKSSSKLAGDIKRNVNKHTKPQSRYYGPAIKGALLFSILAPQVLASDVEEKSTSFYLEEVVVTAEKRSQNIQDVPLAVTSLGGEKISPSGISDLHDIALQAPNLTVTSFNIGEPQLFMRGIGSTSDSAGSDPTVSVFIDEVYIGRPGASSFDLYDLDRIEVLRGPQGTLYGRNVTGGAISIYTKKPSEDFEAKLGVTYGNYDYTVLRGYVNGALSQNLYGKFTISKRDRDGYSKNINNGQDLDDANNISSRAQLLFVPNDTTEIKLSLGYSEDDTNGTCRNLAKFDRQDQNFGGVYVADQEAIVKAAGVDDPRKCGQTPKHMADKDIFGTSVQVDHNFDWATLTSITAYRKAAYEWRQELAGLDAPPGYIGVLDHAKEESSQVSQELRLSNSSENLDWVVGLYAIEENVDRVEDVPLQFGPIPDFPLAGVHRDRTFAQDATNKSYAVFGQFTWAFTDTLSMTLGGRYTKDKKEMDQFFVQDGAFVYDFEGLNKTWSKFTPRLSLDWKVTDDHMLYFTASQGFKSGIFLSQNTSPIAASSTLEPETATNFEVGAKTQWWDNRLQVNAAVFDLEVDDLQLFRLDGARFTLVTENAVAEVEGVELEVKLAATENLMFSGTYSYLDAKFNGGTFDGNSLARSPDYKWSLSANYHLPLDNGAQLDFNASASYSDEYFMETTNVDVGLEEDYTVYDASIKYTSAADNFDITFWGKNLSDELITKHSIVASFGGSVELYQPPRTYGATFNYYFK